MSQPEPPQMPPTFAPYASYATRPSGVADAEHLKLLAIFHYIWAGLLALFSCFGLLYILLGVLALTGQMQPAGTTTYVYTSPSGGPGLPPGVTIPPATPYATQPGGPPPAWFGYIFVAMGSVFLLGGWTLAACTVAAGRSITKRRRWLFVLIVAILNCLLVPIGTVLGVFTLIVMLRDTVRNEFNPALRTANPA